MRVQSILKCALQSVFHARVDIAWKSVVDWKVARVKQLRDLKKKKDTT